MEELFRTIPAVEGIRTVEPGMGEAFDFGDVHFRWKVRNDDSAYHYTVFELALDPGQGVDLHSHPSPETFYVLEGTVNFYRMRDGRLETVPCGVGTTVNIPPNALHALFNESDRPARLLDVSTPSHQAFFDAISKANAKGVFEGLDPGAMYGRMSEIGREYEMHLVPYDVRTGQAIL